MNAQDGEQKRIQEDTMNKNNSFHPIGNPLTRWLLLGTGILIIKILYQYFNGIASFIEVALQGVLLAIVCILYFRNSRYAWHAIALFWLSGFPIFYLFNEIQLPGMSLWFSFFIWCVLLLLMIRLRRSYKQYMDNQEELFINMNEATPRGINKEEFKEKIKTERLCLVGVAIGGFMTGLLILGLIWISRILSKEKKEELKDLLYLIGSLLSILIVVTIIIGIASFIKILYYRYIIRKLNAK